MASKKISEFTAKLTAAVDADQLAILDSENADDNARITRALLLDDVAKTADLGTAASLDVGTGAGDVAAGDAPAAAASAAVGTHETNNDHDNLPTTAQKAALDGAPTASGANPFATINDVGSALTPADIDTLAELNTIITDATLIDTTDTRLSDARAPAPPDWATLTTTGTSPSVTLTIPLDGGAYECQVPAGGIDVLAYTLPANDATAKQYGAYLKITAPVSGTETVTIPAAWDNLGPLASISLTAGDDAIALVLWTDNDNDSAPTIQYAATQKDLQVSAGGIEAPPSDGNYYAYKDNVWVDITNKIINP